MRDALTSSAQSNEDGDSKMQYAVNYVGPYGNLQAAHSCCK